MRSDLLSLLRFALLTLAALLVPGGQAGARVVTLICGVPGNRNGARIDIDVTAQRVACLSFIGGPCSRYDAQVTDRSIRFGNNTIDRATGVIHWALGDVDMCRRASGDILR